MRLLLLLPLVLLAAGCGDSRMASTTTSKAETGVLSVESVAGHSDTYYAEGALWQLRSHPVAGAGEFSQLTSQSRIEVALLPGTYELESASVPCDGNCTMLDGPTDSCSAQVRIVAGERTERTVRTTVGKRCRIS